MKKQVSFSILFAFSVVCFAAGERSSAGGRSMAMGGLSVTLCDLWSLYNNEAGAAWIGKGGAGLAFENRFMVRELMTEQLAAALSWKAGTFGILVSRYGSNLYNETSAGFVYARKFGSRFSAGVQIGGLRVHLDDDYGNRIFVRSGIGLMYRDERRLTVGVQVINPVPVKLGVSPREYLPTVFTAGISWHFSGSFQAGLELEKDLQHQPVFRAGGEYHFAKPVYARLGVSAAPMAFTFGCGLELGRLSIDLASGYHQVLGFSPGGAVVYRF